MLNIKLLKKNFYKYKYILFLKNYNLNINFLNFIIENVKYEENKILFLLKKRNKIIKYINKNYFKKKIYIIKVLLINKIIKKYKPRLLKLKNKLNNYLLNIPNIPDYSIIKLNNNKEIYKHGKLPIFKFKIKNHIELTKNKQYFNYLEFEKAVQLTKSKFVIMHGELAKLYRILGQFMLDIHINNHKYHEFYLPYIVNNNSLLYSGQFPKFKNQLFYINKNIFNNENYALIPTAEVPLVNIIRNTTFLEKQLPLRFVSLTPCFRVEAGSYGKISQGLIRLHQFDKVELVQIVNNKKSMLYLEEITLHAENILKLLNLPYRKLLLCPNETNFTSSKTYDLEVWIPSLNKYLEVSSCSNTTDFQSRRLKSKYKNNINQVNYVHILNASGLAIGRILLALIENYQDKNGNIIIPKILKPYFPLKNKIILNNINI